MKYPNLANPTVSQFGDSLASLVGSLYSGDGARKLAERQAAIDARNAQTELARAKVADMSRKASQAQQDKADLESLPQRLVGSLFPNADQAKAVNDYRSAGGMVQPQAETADQPGIVGGYPMDRPAGYTPDVEARLTRDLYDSTLSRGLTGKTNFEQLSKGQGARQEQDIVRGALDGIYTPRQMEPVAAAYGAIKGAAPYKESSTGQVTQGYTGEVQQTPISQANVALKGAQGQNQAASAGQHAATAAKVRSETLPQTTMPMPGNPDVQVPVLGKDASKAAASAVNVGGGYDEGGKSLAAHSYLLTGKLPTGFGGRGASAQQRAEVTNMAAKIATEWGLTPAEAAMLPTNNKVKQKALGNVLNITAGIERAGEILDQHFGILVDMAQKMDPTRIQLLNKAIIGGQQQFNDPEANAYAAQMQQVMLEYGKLKAGANSQAMLPVEAMKLGQNALSIGLDVPSLEAIHNVVKRDVAINRRVAHEQAGAIQASMIPSAAQGTSQVAPAAPAASPAAPAPAAGGMKSFQTEAQAQAAEAAGTLKKGERVTIGGKTGTWQ